MKIEILGIKVNTIIGWYLEERNTKQEIIIDLICELYPSYFEKADNLDSTINYDEIIRFVKNEVELTNYKLLESLAQYLARRLLEKYKLINNANITLTKPAICGKLAESIKVNYLKERKHKIALAIGSNLNNPEQQIINVVELLGEFVTDIKIGNFYKTKPFGGVIQDDFINSALSGYVTCQPHLLLAKIKQIEKLIGKKEIIKNGPRIIDIDIILFNDLVYKRNFLQIPHKDMHLRDFVLQPLADIEPDWQHPVYKQTISQLLTNLTEDRSIIEQVSLESFT